MKILAIGAHFDDVELGCGGSLLAWSDQGCDLTIFVAARSGYSDPLGNVIRSDRIARDEGLQAAQLLGARIIEGDFPHFEVDFTEALTGMLLRAKSEVQPDLVLTHWSGDVHHDHRSLGLATLHCFRHTPRVLLYRSNWYDGTSSFNARFFVDISGTLERKLQLVSCFVSENDRTTGRWMKYVKAQAVMHGLRAGVAYAEAFQVVRWLA
jgi:N-acetylglucosamine malate deacetylase 1